MKKFVNHSYIYIGIIVWIIFVSLAHVQARAQAEITLLSVQSLNSLFLELSISDAPVFWDVSVSGKMYQSIEFAGMGKSNELGKPQVLVMGTLIAVPEDGDVVVEVLDGESVLFSNILLAPVPKLSLSSLSLLSQLFLEDA